MRPVAINHNQNVAFALSGAACPLTFPGSGEKFNACIWGAGPEDATEA